MTDCSSIHGSSTSSSDLNSHSSSKIRTVRLIRPHTGNRSGLTALGHPPFSSFGFSIRGGREHNTGFFISNVIKGSEADLKGLQVGDQIIRVGGCNGSYRVDDAVHKEITQFISNQDRLTMKVRGVGIVPVKENASDPLTWQVVSLPHHNGYTSNTNGTDEMIMRDVRIVLNVAPRTKLGCGICKGPEWRPGIFVQFTNDGIAKQAGLRPGDQILSCNGVDFTEIAFTEAVAIMKSNSVLELLVRTCAGLDLFPSESSGYNSSASSITGDQSPCWGESSKRLSVVREESTSSGDRLKGLNFKSNGSNGVEWRQDRAVPAEIPKIPMQSDNSVTGRKNSNTTVIKLSEDGPTMINNTLVPSLKTINNTVYEEISNSKTHESHAKHEKLAATNHLMKKSESKVIMIEQKRHSVTKIEAASIAAASNEQNFGKTNPSSVEQSSLSDAINEELRKRAEKKLTVSGDTNSGGDANSEMRNDGPTMTMTLGSKSKMSTTSPAIHNILMDEFKRAHQKMFKTNENQKDFQHQPTAASSGGDKHLEDRRKLSTHEIPAPKKSESIATNGNKISVVVDLKATTTTPAATTSVKKVKPPPPPPPIKKDNRPYLEPKPDYDSLDSSVNTVSRLMNKEKIKANHETAELESIDSFQLSNPQTNVPSPPSMYFSSPRSYPPTLKKAPKQVSVMINTYDDKTEPGKFGFFESSDKGYHQHATNNGDMSSRLKSELEKTLSRSNLKHRSESIENLNVENEIPPMRPLVKKYETNTKSGILKNGSSSSTTSSSHAKNITFGDIKY